MIGDTIKIEVLKEMTVKKYEHIEGEGRCVRCAANNYCGTSMFSCPCSIDETLQLNTDRIITPSASRKAD